MRTGIVGGLVALLAYCASASGQQLNVICPVQAEWCSLAATEFEKETGIKVGVTLKGSGESFAQVAAEKANPKLDVWFGGTGDPHLQAAEQGMLEEYKSPLLAQLQPWAQKQAEQQAAQQTAQAQQQGQAQANADHQGKLDTFKRAFSACMDAREYSVK